MDWSKPRHSLAENEKFLLQSWEEFDMCPDPKIRQEWLFRRSEDVDEMLERVETFLEINDFRTVGMILGRLGTYHAGRTRQIVGAMVRSVRNAMKNGEYAVDIVLKILCRKIDLDASAYGEDVRELYSDFLGKYYSFGNRSEERVFRWISMILLNIGHVEDRSFVSFLEETSFDDPYIQGSFKYTSVCSEFLKMEGLRQAFEALGLKIVPIWAEQNTSTPIRGIFILSPHARNNFA